MVYSYSKLQTMKKYLFAIVLISWSLFAQAQDFITRWDLSIAGSGATQLTFGVGTSGTCSYTWETIPAGTVGSGTFSGNTITITGLPANAVIRLIIDTTNFRRININFGSDKNRLKNVEQWGGVHWNSMESAFLGCIYLNITAIDIPNLSNVTTMSSMLRQCTYLNSPVNINNWNTSNVSDMSRLFEGVNNFNQPIGNWNTSSVTNMYGMFLSALAFNQPIGNWNTSNVTNMSGMFSGTSNFNQAIGNWNTSNVTNMSGMFSSANYFNQAIGNWNTSNVTNMGGMFYSAQAFNQPIGNWNTLNVANMSYMFYLAHAFNQPIGNWNTSNVTNMSSMFRGAYAFNQPIGNWNTSNVTDMSYLFAQVQAFNQPIGNWNTVNVTTMYCMFLQAYSFNQPLGNWQLNPNVNINYMLHDCGLDCTNYSATLSGWSNNPNTPSYRWLEALYMKYFLSAQNDRNYLLWNKGWTISGDNLANNNCCIEISVTVNQTACDSYLFDGQILTNSGTYYDTLMNVSGCDSSIILNLTINQSTADTISQSACSSYFFNGQTLTNSGTYYDTLMNVNGCDSLITLNITINSSSITINDSACSSYFFNGQTLTNSGTYYDTLMNVNGCDSLITLNLTLNYSSTTFSDSACNSYFFNGQTITNSGTYFDTLLNIYGCDSLITLNLIINQADTTLAQSGANFIANATGATYQWLTCNPFQKIIGEVNQTYSATANGEYAVIVSQNGCTDTSACYTVVGIGTNTFELSNNIKIYPNPVFHTLQVEAENEIQHTSVKLIDVTGKVLLERASSSLKKISIDMSSYSSGNYFIQITNPDFSYVKKIYKE